MFSVLFLYFSHNRPNIIVCLFGRLVSCLFLYLLTCLFVGGWFVGGRQAGLLVGCLLFWFVCLICFSCLFVRLLAHLLVRSFDHQFFVQPDTFLLIYFGLQHIRKRDLGTKYLLLYLCLSSHNNIYFVKLMTRPSFYYMINNC